MTTQARELAGIISNAGDLNFSDDITLGSDGAVLNFGADSEVTITHVHNAGVLLNSTKQLQFGDSGTYINQSADGVLNITSDTEVEINATTVDINANVDVSGNIVLAGTITVGDADDDNMVINANVNSHIIPNTDDTFDLGSASQQWRNVYVDGTVEADAITIGGVTLSETIADTVGAMTTSNTESGITVAYDDGDNTLDFTVATLNQDTTGTADLFTASANNSTDETVYPVFVDGATGSQGAETDTGLTYNPSSGLLTAIGFSGALTGNVTGNTSGTAATVTTAAQPAITSVGTLSSLVLGGDLSIPSTITHVGDTNTKLDFNQADTMRLITGGNTAWIANASSMIINEDSADFDFRVESNGNDHMLYVGGTEDKVGIGGANLQSALSVQGADDAITFNVSTSLSSTGSYQGMAFGAHNAMKGAILYERQTNYARGRLVFAVDATADTSDANLSDAVMYINYDKTVSLVSHLIMPDAAEIRLGASADLTIRHDGSDSTIIDSGTGNLLIGSNSFYLRNAANSETMLRADENSYVKLYFDNAEKLATHNTGITVTGNVNLVDDDKIIFGTGDDANIKHDGSNFHMSNNYGVLYIDQNQNDGNLILRCDDGSGGLAEYISIDGGSGAVNLKHYGNTKLATTSTGITVTGAITSSDKTVSASDPAANSNPSAIGHLWLNSTSGEAYICTVATANSNQWTNIGDGSGAKPFAGFDLMMIGGGGGGAGELKGGGGAGGLLYFTGFTGAVAYGTSYTITIGAGGTPNGGSNGNSGGDTTAFGETAGGGQGGQAGGGNSGTSAVVTSNFITSIGDTSFSGGTNAGNPGAGGAGSAQNGETRPGGNGDGGYGGAGQYISGIYNGSDTYAWAGGGGGPGYGNTEDGGAGGVGGGGGGGCFSEGSPSGSGGAGGAGLNNGDAGTSTNTANNGGDGGANTGSGGGGGSHRGGGQSSATGGPGGSGIVCIKQIQTENPATTTGTVVKTTADGYRYYAFTSSGSITFVA